MAQDESVLDLVAAAAFEMSTAYGADYDNCKSYVLTFLGVEDEAALYNLQLKADGEASSTSLRHVMKNARKVRVVDIIQALTTAAGVALATQDPIKFSLAATSAGLFFIKVFRNAVTVKLDPADASILWALNRLGNHATHDNLLREWKNVVAESKSVEAATSDAKLTARLSELEKLGCIFIADGRVAFAESISADDVTGQSA
jgi:hypothetical protein